MARRKLHLHGSLKKLAPNGLELEADTVFEAINGMCKLLGIKPNAITGRMTVKVLGFEKLDLIMGQSDQRDLHVVPALTGAGLFGDIIKITVGAVLMVAGVFIAPYSPLAGAFLFNLGATLVVGGLINMLFPIKKADEEGGYLGAPGNTTAIGTRIALIFGETLVYGQVLSYNIDSVQT